MDWRRMQWQNLQIANYEGEGEYACPIVKPIYELPKVTEYIPFNFAKTCKNAEWKGVHFYLHDYQFERVWSQPYRYLDLLRRFSVVNSPDFSLYTDFPLAVQIFNHYRKQWLSRFWQDFGMTVIPSVNWGDSKSFRWCFDGMPHESIVAVSSVGSMKRQDLKLAFLRGYEEMTNRLNPSTVLFWGNVPAECEGNIIHMDTYTENMRKRVQFPL